MQQAGKIDEIEIDEMESEIHIIIPQHQQEIQLKNHLKQFHIRTIVGSFLNFFILNIQSKVNKNITSTQPYTSKPP